MLQEFLETLPLLRNCYSHSPYLCIETTFNSRNLDICRVTFVVFRKCGINGLHFSSPNRPLLSAGIQKISPLQPRFFIGSENLCSKDGACCRYLGCSEMCDDACVLQKFTGHRTSSFLEIKKKNPANQQKNFEELCCPTTRPQSFSFELLVFMEPHCALSLHSCTIVALCLLQQCVVTPRKRSAISCLSSWAHVSEFFTLSWKFNLETVWSECFK